MMPRMRAPQMLVPEILHLRCKLCRMLQVIKLSSNINDIPLHQKMEINQGNMFKICVEKTVK